MNLTANLKKAASFIPILILGFSMNLLQGQNSERPVDPLIRKFLDPNKYPGMMAAAHRGFWYTAPENSIKAVQDAIDMDADMAEVDVNHTSDNVLILMHDSALERTTTIEDHPNYNEIKQRYRPGTETPAGEALVNNVSWEELNLKNSHGVHYVKLKDRHGNIYYEDSNNSKSYQTVPKVTQILATAKDKILLNLDKADRYLVKIWALIKEHNIQDQTITKGYLSLWELKQKYDINFLNEIMSQHMYTPIANDKVPFDHLPKLATSYPNQNLDDIEESIKDFMTDFLEQKDVNNTPWADAFEPNPESLNSPIIPLIQSIAIPNNRRVGTFSAYADLGEGHAINRGKWKFDPPFELRQNWDLCMKNGVDYIITDRIKFLQEYKDAIEKKREEPSGVLNPVDTPPTPKEVLVATHRAGNGSLGPENTLFAVKQCIDLGVNIIEVDIFKSKDGIYHVFHDKTLAKMTDVKSFYNDRTLNDPSFPYPIKYSAVNYTSNEIKRLKLRGRKNGNPTGYTDYKIPTLKEVLKVCKNKILIRLDKWDDSTTRGNVVSEILDLIQQEDMIDQVIFGGTHTTVQIDQAFGDRSRDIQFSPVINDGTSERGIDSYLENNRYKIPFFRVRIGNVNATPDELDKVEKLIKYIIEEKKIRTYNSLVLTGENSQSGTAKDDKYGWKEITNQGINILETDYPLELKAWLENEGFCVINYDELVCPK